MSAYKTSTDYQKLYDTISQNDIEIVVFVYDKSRQSPARPMVSIAVDRYDLISVGYPGMGYITIYHSHHESEAARRDEFIGLCKHYKLEWIEP